MVSTLFKMNPFRICFFHITFDTYILLATFSIGVPLINSFKRFKKLCPILARVPSTLANASIPLLNYKRIPALYHFIRNTLKGISVIYRSRSEVFTSLPSRTSMSTLTPACDASWPSDLCNLKVIEKRQFMKICDTYLLYFLSILIYLRCTDIGICDFDQIIIFVGEINDGLGGIWMRSRDCTRNE